MPAVKPKQLSEARFRKLFDETHAMSIQGYRSDGTVVYWNAASEKIYGYSPAEALGKNLLDLIIPSEMREEVRSAVDWMFANKTGIPSGRLNLKHKNGSSVPVYSSHTVVELPGEEPIMFCMDADMRALDLAEAEVQKLSYFDVLTGLPNRRLLLDHLQGALQGLRLEHQYGALLLLDIDNFHGINDTLGYDAGDQVLVACARRLQHHISEPSIVARIAADEFVVLLQPLEHSIGAAATEAELAAQRLLQALRRPVAIDQQPHNLQAKIGITVFGNRSEDQHELLRQVDIALKHAKSREETAIAFFDRSMEANIQRRIKLSQALSTALEKEQFFLEVQPQVDVQQHVVGYEALLRWRHPVLGLIPPDEFIPIAESNHSIHAIGDWVFEQCCWQIVRWQKANCYHHLRLSINVSAVQFRRDDYVKRTQSILQRAGADPAQLRLELTESLMAGNIDFIVEQMQALKDLGLSLSLDDFGTGYASLAYLTRFPLDELKIDRAFVTDLADDGKGALLAATIIGLGRNMNLTVIAEGVETIEQFGRLRDMGCEVFQGYWFGKPSPHLPEA